MMMRLKYSIAIAILINTQLSLLLNGQELDGGCHFENSNTKRIACDGAKGEVNLKNAMDAMRHAYPGASIQHLTIEGAKNLLWLPGPEIFKDIDLSEITLQHFNLPFWKTPLDKSKPKMPLKSLLSLNLRRMEGIPIWNWAEVAEFSDRKMKSLSVAYSDWFRIRSDFSQLFGQHVTSLSIENCKVVYLDDNSLNCPSCNSINLQYNDIREVRREIFGLAPRRLTYLGLSGNQISELPDDLFQNINFEYQTSDMFQITLTDNPIKELKEETFKPLKVAGLKTIMISLRKSQGSLICDCRMRWLGEKPFDITYVNCGASHSQPFDTKKLKDFLRDC